MLRHTIDNRKSYTRRLHGGAQPEAAGGSRPSILAYSRQNTRGDYQAQLNSPDNLSVCETLLVQTSGGDTHHMWDSALPYTMSHNNMSPPDFRTTWRKFL